MSESHPGKGSAVPVTVEDLVLVVPAVLHGRGLCSCPEEESYACPDDPMLDARWRSALEEVLSEIVAENREREVA